MGPTRIRSDQGNEDLTALYNQTINGTVSVNDPVYWDNPNSRWEKATSSTTKPSGIYVGSNTVALNGHASGLSGLTSGTFYYLAASGGLTSSATSTLIGQAISTTDLIVDIDANSGGSLADGSVTLAKLATQADQTFLGNVSGGVASPIALTVTQVKTALKYYDIELLGFLGLS